MRLMLLVAALAAASPALAEKPDLIPDFDPTTGIVTIGNFAKGAVTKATYVTQQCRRLSPPPAPGIAGGGCPEMPKGYESYIHKRVPDRATFSIGPLASGAKTTHQLAFWSKLAWTTGTYQIDVTADAFNGLDEVMEENNKRGFSKTYPN